MNRSRSSTRRAPRRSCTAAVVMITASSRPMVSTTMCRLRPAAIGSSELPGDLAVGQAARHEFRDLRLAAGQPGRLGDLGRVVEAECDRLVERQSASLVIELRRGTADARAPRPATRRGKCVSAEVDMCG